MKKYPTPWQQKTLWSAVTALAIAVIAGLGIYSLVGVGRVLGFLQPILIPVAVAGILAYLLNPLVDFGVKRGLARPRAVLAVFALVLLPLTLVALWVIPEIYQQSFALGKDLPSAILRGKTAILGAVQQYQQNYADNPYVQQITDWLKEVIPTLPPKIWNFISGGLQGFLGVFGFLLGMIVVPIYLYFFLVNAGPISLRWGDYLPLRASSFKDEVVDCLNEINSYIIAFFRGQILVTMIDGALLGACLLAMGLKFALVIGLMVAVLQLIPYLGIMICWCPAVLIAFAQWQDWQHPLWVTLIFFLVVQLEGFIVAPKIVGESVGLHAMTIIVSMFVWTYLIGGLLGALLAVPLTATLKVLLRRYIWQKRPELPPSMESDYAGTPPA